MKGNGAKVVRLSFMVTQMTGKDDGEFSYPVNYHGP
jgi:hypothetical protein